MVAALISRASRRFLKSSLRPSIFNPFISSQSPQFVDPKPTPTPSSLTPFHLGISNLEFRKRVRALPSFQFVAHFSTLPSGSKENKGGEGGSGAGDELSDLAAELERVEREIHSLELEIEAEGPDEAKQERLDLLNTVLSRIQSHVQALEQGLRSEQRRNVSTGGIICWTDKPISKLLLLWPCAWSITLAAPLGHLPDLKLLALIGFGALHLTVTERIVNDLLDRDIDTKAERTKFRPVAMGFLTPSQGFCLLGFELLLGLWILLQLNYYCRVLGASFLLLVFSYPLMKRFAFWPQAYLGLIYNWGALLGWAAVKGNLDPSIVLPLYASGVYWTIVYDTLYAHQDKRRVKSTALPFGDSTKEWITGFGIASLGCLASIGFNAELGWPYYAFLAVASGHLGRLLWTVDLSSNVDCHRKLVSMKWFGAIIFGGILAGRLSS